MKKGKDQDRCGNTAGIVQAWMAAGLSRGASKLPVEDELHHLVYSAGIMILDTHKPGKILYRSRFPILEPVLPEEKTGIVQSVVFPTGIDRRDDLGTPNRFDIYYGMADNYIGIARLDIPDELLIL